MMTRTTPSIDEHHALQRLVYETSTDAIVWLGEDGRVLHVNAAAREMPWSDVEAALLSRWTRDPEVIAFRAELRTRGRATLEIRWQSGREEHRHLAIEGRTLGRDAVLMLRDVTAQRRLEEEVAHLRSVAALGEFTASVVHDFGNLVTPISCMRDLLAREVEPGTHAEELVTELGAVTERARAFLRQLLSFVRRRPTPPTRVDVGEVMDELRPLLERLVGEDVRVEMVLDRPTHAVVDRVHLERVLLNLAANARDAMPLGGKLLLRTHVAILDDERAKALRCPSSGAFVVVSVTDEGSGMAPEVRARALDPFFTTKAIDGSGLGLASAHRFVSDHGGCIELRSEIGEGTMVALYLPRAETTAALPPASEERANAILSEGETILLVEDDPFVRRGVRRLLETHGYRVLCAPCGDDALTLARRNRATIDLVVADVVVPQSNGAWIDRARNEGLAAPVIHLTAYGDDLLARRGIADASVLHKDFAARDLLRLVRATLDAERPPPSRQCV